MTFCVLLHREQHVPMRFEIRPEQPFEDILVEMARQSGFGSLEQLQLHTVGGMLITSCGELRPNQEVVLLGDGEEIVGAEAEPLDDLIDSDNLDAEEQQICLDVGYQTVTEEEKKAFEKKAQTAGLQATSFYEFTVVIEKSVPPEPLGLRLGMLHGQGKQDWCLVLRLTRHEDGQPRRAEAAGVHIGDRLVKVNGEGIAHHSAIEMIARASYPLSLAFMRAQMSNWTKFRMHKGALGAWNGDHNSFRHAAKLQVHSLSPLQTPASKVEAAASKTSPVKVEEVQDRASDQTLDQVQDNEEALLLTAFFKAVVDAAKTKAKSGSSTTFVGHLRQHRQRQTDQGLRAAEIPGNGGDASAAAAIAFKKAGGRRRRRRLRKKDLIVKSARRHSTSIYEGDMLREGILLKLSSGMRKRWQERYFTVRGHYLKYYPTAAKETLKGALDLNSLVGVSLDPCGGRPEEIVLTMGSLDGAAASSGEIPSDPEDQNQSPRGEVTLHLRATTAQEAKSWQGTLATFLAPAPAGSSTTAQ